MNYSAASDEIHILDRLAVIYRYRRIAVAVFVLASAAMMIQGYSNIQVYQAQAQILIEDERSTAVPGITSTDNTYYQDPEPYYQTQYRILRGRDLSRQVIKQSEPRDRARVQRDGRRSGRCAVSHQPQAASLGGIAQARRPPKQRRRRLTKRRTNRLWSAASSAMSM